MKRSLGAGVALALLISLTACGGEAKSAAQASTDAAFDACIQEWSQGAADFKGGKAEDYVKDPDIIETCEAFRDLEGAMESLPAYTPEPAAELDQECLRDWAEANTGMFDGMSVEEIMEDPMARFNCE